MLNCYLLDDEQHSIDGLKAMLQKKFADRVLVCGSSISVSAALEEIEHMQPDVLFLDVEMPEMNGMEVLRHFPARKFQVVFTTAHERYALPALKASAVDYLVKPLSPQDVHDAIEKCIQRKNAAVSNGSMPQRIALASAQELLLVHADDIIRVEAQNNYSHFYFTNRPKLVVSKTLREFDHQLTPLGFYRVHQSHLVNLKHVEAVQSSDGDYALLAGNHRVEISRRQKADFLRLVKNR